MVGLVCFSLILKAQLTFNQFYLMATSVYNPYNINSRSYLDIVDTLLLKQYIISSFQETTLSPSGATIIICTLSFENPIIQSEKLVISSNETIQNNKSVFSFRFTASTQSLTEFNSWLQVIRIDPDFYRDYTFAATPFDQNYLATASVGQWIDIMFGISASGPTNNTNLTTPITYTMALTRT